MRPRIRIPLWAAAALPAAAYVFRAILRGFDFRPDLPMDAVAFGGLALLMLTVGVARRLASASDQRHQALTEKMDHSDSETGNSR